MAELPDGPKQPNQSPAGEHGMEKRMLLAFVLMGLILLITPYFYKTVAPPAAKPAQTTTASKPEAKAPQTPTAAPTPAEQADQKAAAPATPVSAEKEETTVVNTNLYQIVFSNRGAVVKSWTLKKFKDSSGKPLQLVNTAAAQKAGYPFSLAFKDKKPQVDVNQALYAAKPAPGGLGVDYEYSNGNVVIRKSFRFQKDKYLSEFTSSASLDGAPLPNLVQWLGGFGDPAVVNPASNQHTLYYDVAANKLIVKDAKAGKDGPVTETGDYSFAGIEDTYFAAVVLPSNGRHIEVTTYSNNVPGALNSKDEPHVGVGVGGNAQNKFALFVGPKDMDLLGRIDPKLQGMIDWGWFGFIAKPLFLILNWVNDNWVHNFGWAIILVTIFINFALLPLKFTSMKSMKKMQALQPQLAAINARYKSISIKDPRKAQQNQEVMDLYKKNGVNPMGGCLPMLIQIPFFFAFYKVLMVAPELRGASWLWVTDLSQPEHLAIRILPIAMIVSQFAMQKMTPTTVADPNQQKMMLIMPLVFGFMFYQFQSGLVLYWLTSNLVGIAQQWFINKTSPAPAVVVQETAKKRR